jgi:hypothetical protein
VIHYKGKGGKGTKSDGGKGGKGSTSTGGNAVERGSSPFSA